MSLTEAATFWLFVSYFGGATQLIFGVELAALATAGWRKGWNARLETLTNEGLDLLVGFDRVAAICCWWGAMGAAMLVLEHWAQGEWEVALKGAGIALIALALGLLADARSWSLGVRRMPRAGASYAGLAPVQVRDRLAYARQLPGIIWR